VRCALLRSSSPVRGVAVTSSRGDGVEHRGVVEPALDLPAAAGGVAGHVQLIGVRGWAVVGFLAVLVEHLDQLHTPVAQLGRGVQRGLRGQLLFDRSPLLRGQPLRGPRLRHAGDRVDVAQTRLARGEHPGSVR
jgi:hypothetical protein